MHVYSDDLSAVQDYADLRVRVTTIIKYGGHTSPSSRVLDGRRHRGVNETGRCERATAVAATADKYFGSAGLKGWRIHGGVS